VRGGLGRRRFEELREAEVEDPDGVAAPRIGDEPDVVWLQVPVDDPVPVGLVEGERDLFDDVDDDDVRVAQAARSPCLAAEPLERLGVLDELRKNDLFRDHAARADVRGPIDRAHATPADEPLDPVLPVESPSEKRIRRRHS
jgi:hypothetical protein